MAAQTRPIPFGRFQLYRRLGAGGMGEVFRAEMLGPDGFARPVVVKRLLPELTKEAEAVSMFIEEARLAARLVHPNIVQVHDFGKVSNRYYLVMEMVEGCDLARLLHHFAEQKRLLPLGASLTVVTGLLEALSYAHEAHDESGNPLALVHRDISPSNVLLSMAGEVKLTDFGIAKTRARLPRTTYGQLKGKIPYMSPEQAEGRPLDSRSDLFSVGVLLFQLLVGQRPFRGKSADDVLDKIRIGTYLAPSLLNPHVGPNVSEVIRRALEKRPEARFQTAREFKGALSVAAARDGIVPDIETLRTAVHQSCKAQEQAFEDEETSLERPGPEHGGPTNLKHAPARGHDPTELLLDPPHAKPAAVEAKAASDVGPSAPAQSMLSTDVGQGAGTMRVIVTTALVAALVTILAIGIAMKFFSGASQPKTLRIAIRMFPVQEAWLRQEVFVPFERKHDCKIEVTEFNATDELLRLLENGEADVAKVDAEHAPLLVQRATLRRLSELGERVDASAFREVRSSLRPEALQLGMYATVTGEDLYLLPRKLEVQQLVYRPAMVKLAVSQFPSLRDALDARLRMVMKKGLPPGYELHANPAHWTSWDLIAVAFTWAHVRIRGEVKARYTVRSGSDKLFAEQLFSQAALGGATDPWGPSPAMVDLFFLFSVMRELDLFHPDIYKNMDATHARQLLATGELGAYVTNQIDVGLIAGNGQGAPQLIDDPKDLDVAPPPRPVSLDMSTETGSFRVAREGTVISGWGWGVPRRSQHPELGMQLILFMLSKDRHAAELERFPILRVRSDVDIQWPLSRRLNAVADEQMAEGKARFLPWPTGAGQTEAIVKRLDRAFRQIVLRRGYGRLPITRTAIETELRRELAQDR